MSYYGGRAYRDRMSDTVGESEWVCQQCGTINNIDWPCCDHCGYDQDGNPPPDETEDE